MNCSSEQKGNVRTPKEGRIFYDIIFFINWHFNNVFPKGFKAMDLSDFFYNNLPQLENEKQIFFFLIWVKTRWKFIRYLQRSQRSSRKKCLMYALLSTNNVHDSTLKISLYTFIVSTIKLQFSKKTLWWAIKSIFTIVKRLHKFMTLVFQNFTRH